MLAFVCGVPIASGSAWTSKIFATAVNIIPPSPSSHWKQSGFAKAHTAECSFHTYAHSLSSLRAYARLLDFATAGWSKIELPHVHFIMSSRLHWAHSSKTDIIRTPIPNKPLQMGSAATAHKCVIMRTHVYKSQTNTYDTLNSGGRTIAQTNTHGVYDVVRTCAELCRNCEWVLLLVLLN